MLESVVLLIFTAALLGCILWNIPVLWALIFGLVLFSAYALWKKHSPRALWGMVLSGVKTVRHVLFATSSVAMATGTDFSSLSASGAKRNHKTSMRAPIALLNQKTLR